MTIRRHTAEIILFAGGLLLGSLLTAAFAVGWATTNRQHNEAKP